MESLFQNFPVASIISAMTDRFAISTYQELFIPKTWTIV